MKSNDAYQILDRSHPDFATMPIAEACNWSEFAAQSDLDRWYLVVFRSTRKPDADGAKLEALGEAAQQDAALQPGYLHYFKGNVTAGKNKLKNLSFCMWRTRGDAEAAAKRDHHQTAIKHGIGMYQEYIVERYDARIKRDESQPRVELKTIAN